MARPDDRVLALTWSVIMGFLVFVPLLGFAWAHRYRLRWQLTMIFLLYVVAMIVLLASLRH
jgi:hypothetical protein